MKRHNSITLELKKDKSDNVYRYIDRWQLLPSSYGDCVFYLLVQALVQWGPKRDFPAKVFSIVMQYSPEIGQSVDISQPAHIHEDDVDLVIDKFRAFKAGKSTS